MSLINTNRVTRQNRNTNGGTLIDHIFTNIEKNSFNIVDYGCSDHKAIISVLELPLIRPKDMIKQTRKFSEENWKLFEDLLIKEDWQLVYD